MKKLLIPIAAMLCLLPGCDYSICDCEEYQKQEEFSKAQEHSAMSSEYAALLQEATELNVTLRNRKAQLANAPSVNTKIGTVGKDKSFIELAKNDPDVDRIIKKFESLQPQLEASCAYRGFATLEFLIEKGHKLQFFYDIDGSISGSKVRCIHDVLHDTSFDINHDALRVRHTFFIRDPKGTIPETKAPTEIPEPLAIKRSLDAFQNKLIGNCGVSKPGGIKLEFRIDDRGNPYNINILENALKDEEVKDCIILKLRHAELPPFPTNKQPTMQYVFRN